MPQSGFTLLEVLVVTVLIAVLSAVLVLAAAPSATTQARDEARRLAALLELAIAEARANGQGIAWSPMPGGYAFFRRADDGEWVSYADDSAYRRRLLPEGVELRDVKLAEHLLREGERVVMTPYGLAGAVAATIAAGNAAYTLRAGPIGRVTLVPAQARDDVRSNFETAGLHAG